MKKILFGIAIGLLLIATIRFFSGEDDWICKDGQWIKHGNPDDLMPSPSACK